MLDKRKNISLIVLAVAVIGLLAGAFAAWRGSGIGVGTSAAGAMRVLNIIALVSSVAGVLGVLWLGWQWLTLTAGITSASAWLKSPSDIELKHRDNPVVKDLTDTLQERFDVYASKLDDHDCRVKDLQIQLQLSNRRQRNTEAIIYSICDAVVALDESDRLLIANDAAAELLGFDADKAQHRHIQDVVPDDRMHFVQLLKHCRSSKARATRQELEFTHGDGPRVFDTIVSCVYDERDHICGTVSVLHDITREKEISQAKNDFVSHVSHELKTPLASITAYSEMLVDGEADDEETRSEFYNVIQTQAQRLKRLIEDILNISRIESGLTKVSKEQVSLTILIQEQLKMIKSFASEKNIEVTAPNPIVFDQVNADKDMINQVIVNLLSNAVKYTPAGGKVNIDSQVDDAAQTVVVTVTDTGVGIPEDEVDHVFDKFYRVGANNKQAKGTGLGLNLVKQIVETVHGGRVFVESKQGQGSTFGFELPLAVGLATVETG